MQATKQILFKPLYTFGSNLKFLITEQKSHCF